MNNITTMTTLLIPADLSVPMTACEIGYDTASGGFNLSGENGLYRKIGCDLVEAVACDHPQFQDCLLWCDEEALLRSEPQPNIRASVLAGRPLFGAVILSCYSNGRDLPWNTKNPLPFSPCNLQAMAETVWADPRVQAQMNSEIGR